MTAQTDSTTPPTPQWRVEFRPEQWVRDNAVSVCPWGDDFWYITPDEAASALSRADFDHLALDHCDRRIPSWVHEHTSMHPFTVELICTGCWGSASAIPPGDLGEFAEHDDCAPDAPDAPEAHRDGDREQPYTVEVRINVTALSRDHAREQADMLARRVCGTVTAIFDEDWNEDDDTTTDGEGR